MLSRINAFYEAALNALTFREKVDALMLFWEKHQRFPRKEEDSKLHKYQSELRVANADGSLPFQYQSQLEKLGFIWKQRDANWQDNYLEVEAIISKGDELNHKNYSKYYVWLHSQIRAHKKSELDKQQTYKIQALIEKITTLKNHDKDLALASLPIGKENKWIQKFTQLKAFRQTHPDAWPSADSNDLSEKKLGTWCQDLRQRYRLEKLELRWVEQLSSIQFNFQGRRDKWHEQFVLLKQTLEQPKGLTNVQSNLLVWARRQHTNYDALLEEQRLLLDSINFLSFFEESPWLRNYNALLEFFSRHNSLPKKTDSEELYNWILAQRVSHRKQNLSVERMEKLLSLGVDFEPNEKRIAVWDKHYNTLVEFRKSNPSRWPSFYGNTEERKLYEWCQAQRQVKAGTARNRKELPSEKVERLNAIGFTWSLKEINDIHWETNFQNLQNTITTSGSSVVPSTINGKMNPLYIWIRRQKELIMTGKLSEERCNRLRILGVL